MAAGSDRPIRRPATIRPGQALTAKRLSEGTLAANRFMQGAKAPQQIPTSGASTFAKLTQFRLKEIFDDHLLCVTWNGFKEGTGNVFVAKPYELRVSPFLDGNGDPVSFDGISYVYYSESSLVRRADDDADPFTNEVQKVYPPYSVDDVIIAASPVSNLAGGALTDAETGTIKIDWQDMNVVGRRWISAYREVAFVSHQGNLLRCIATVDGIPFNLDILKPYLLRPSITNRNGISYVYSSDFQRTASGSEIQVIVPSYVAGDKLLISRNDPTDPTNLDYVDDGGARAWAKKSS